MTNDRLSVPMRPLTVACALAVAVAVSACYKPPPETLTLSGSMLTIDNRSKQEWSNVEVWLNTYYRITAQSIPAGGRLQAPLNFFVAGLGQRFNYDKMQIRDLRLTATLPDGKRIEVKKDFEGDGLKGALSGMAKKR
jgi:hypothetical protein